LVDVVFERGWPGRSRDLTGADLVFVEVENAAGRSIQVGEWLTRADGHVVLRLPDPPPPTAVTAKTVEPGPPAEAFHAYWRRGCPFCGSFQLSPELPMPSYAHFCHVDGVLTLVAWP
jgi:hypothetical protein